MNAKRMISVVNQILQQQSGSITKPDLIHAVMEYLDISQRYVKEYIMLLEERKSITIDDNTQVITLNNDEQMPNDEVEVVEDEDTDKIKPKGESPAGATEEILDGRQ